MSNEYLVSDEVKIGYIEIGGKFRKVEYTVVDGLAMFEGDIVLGTAEELAATVDADNKPVADKSIVSDAVITGSNVRWPNSTIPYTIDPALPNQSRVTKAIAHWESNTSIRFVARTNEKDYLTFRPGGGCSSQVGRRGGQQFINLASGCSTGNTIHEIGHTVGLWHTQSREDRDSYVTVNYTNITANRIHNFNQHISDGTDIGSYDYWSIMHYPMFAFSKNGSPTIVPTGGQPIGQRNGLSSGDKAAIRAAYHSNSSYFDKWTSMGGSVKQLAVGQNEDGRLELFGIGKNNALCQIWQVAPNNGWSKWLSRGGMLTKLAVANNKDGRLEVFGRGPNNELWHVWQLAPNGRWSNWSSLGGEVEELCVGNNEDGRIEVFVRNPNGSVSHIWQTAPNNGWSKWSNKGGNVQQIAVANNKDGRLELFAVGADSRLWHIWQKVPNGYWSNWSCLQGMNIKHLSVAQNEDGRLEVFVRGDNDELQHIWQTSPNNGWSTWGSKGGQILNCHAARNQNGRLEVFALGMKASIYQIWQTAPNNGWSQWQEMGSIFSEFCVGSNADGRLEVFARGCETGKISDDQVWHRWQLKPNGTWSG